MPKIDPLIRRLITGTLFAAVFVWVAVRYFNVDTEVIKVLFIFSIAFVIGMIVLGFIGALLVRAFRRVFGERRGMLDNIEATDAGKGTGSNPSDTSPGSE